MNACTKFLPQDHKCEPLSDAGGKVIRINPLQIMTACTNFD